MYYPRLIFPFCFWSFLSFSFFSCENTGDAVNSAPNPIVVLDFAKEYDSAETRLEDLAEDIQFVQLETTPESLLDYFIPVFSDNYILCFTGEEALLFSGVGKFLGKVGQLGKGPDEYRGNSTWAIDEENNYIYCYNSDNSQMIRFYIDTRKVESSFIVEDKGALQEMIILGRDSIAAIKHVNRVFPYKFYYLSMKGDLLGGKAWDTTHYFHSGIFTSPFFFQGPNKEIILQPSNNDTVFSVEGNNLDPILTFNKRKFIKRGNKERGQRFFLCGMDEDQNVVFIKSEDEMEKDGEFIFSIDYIDHSMFTYRSESKELKKARPMLYILQGLPVRVDQLFLRPKGINSFYFKIPVIEILDLCDQFLKDNEGHKNFDRVQALKGSLDLNGNPIIITGTWALKNK